MDLNSDHTVTQWGVKRPNGVIEWQTADDWIPPLSTPEGREMERVSYAQQLSSLGIEQTPDLVPTFWTREKVVTFTPIVEVVEPIVEVESDDDESPLSDPQGGPESPDDMLVE